jgi:orotidine-5'-phosphate decarboxylase
VSVGTASFSIRAPPRSTSSSAGARHGVARCVISLAQWRNDGNRDNGRPADHLFSYSTSSGLDDALGTPSACRRGSASSRWGELYAVAGPEAFDALHHKGFRVFADLKLHDISHDRRTRRPRDFGRHGVEFLNFHAPVVLTSAGAGPLVWWRRRARHRATDRTAVTVLTSDARDSTLESRMETAANAGFDGVVCGGPDIAIARTHNLRTMVPGIRLPGGDAHDQVRVDTPGDAITRGADWIILGRAVAEADDPERAAQQTTRDVAAALARVSG